MGNVEGVGVVSASQNALPKALLGVKEIPRLSEAEAMKISWVIAAADRILVAVLTNLFATSCRRPSRRSGQRLLL